MRILAPSEKTLLDASPRWSRIEQSINAPSRRAIICGFCAAAAAVGGATAAGAEETIDPAANMLAQPGDRLAAFKDGHAGALIDPADVTRGVPPLLAWPFDPAKKLARDGSRLNLILVMHFDPATLSPDEKKRAANGTVAYTAVCTHQGCWVTDWLAKEQLLHCPCHGSRYDPRRDGNVVLGPAPRALPALPLRLAGGRLEVAASFADRIGGEAPAGY
jgi:rieske iron-sulfur protein